MNIDHVVKSLLILLYLLFLLTISSLLIYHCIVKYRSGIIRKASVIISSICLLFTLANIICLGDYVYPFERTLEPVPHGIAVLPDDKALDYPGQKFWHGAYEKYGLYAGSFYFNTEGQPDKYNISWPPMDFENYSYIITYGQKIKTLTYNVWDTIDTPIRTGAKVGHIVFDEQFSPNMVYIYRIPKLRIENDVNKTS